MATGEIIGLLHADDVFFSDNTQHYIMNKFINQNIDFVAMKYLKISMIQSLYEDGLVINFIHFY